MVLFSHFGMYELNMIIIILQYSTLKKISNAHTVLMLNA